MATDRQIYISVANSRSATKWKNKKTTWQELAEKCGHTIRTSETLAEYKAMSKSEQGQRKDVGGFVGGYLKGGLRKKGNVDFRDVLCLDIDYGQVDTWDNYCLLFGNAAFVYSTHKYTSSQPRIRLVILLSRSVTEEEYEAVGRQLAAQIGIDLFDDTTYQPERLMYWPSTSVDGEWFYDIIDGHALDPDAVLASYHDWRDVSEWPYSSRVVEAIRSSATKQGNPTEKPGIVGAFCRCYDIHSVIETYLPDVYDKCGDGSRYTFKSGTVAAGLVVYEDGLFAYSHNATDPCSQHLVNAFDLVRMHKFLYLDEDTDPKTAINNRPSYQSMSELAAKDNVVRQLITSERRSSAMTDFAGLSINENETPDNPKVEEENNTEWMTELDYTSKGKICSTIQNTSIILEKAPEFKGRLWLDDFSGLIRYDGKLPWSTGKVTGVWSNSDESCLRRHMEAVYGVTGKEKIADALVSVTSMHKRHPIRKYLRSLTWDGTPRLETLFIDFLGAPDTELVRAQTRKQFTAAVARIMTPGCKYDYMLVLVGKEGIGKSRILSKMAGEWFNDSLVTMDGKEGMENLRRAWVIEIGELMGIKRSEVESVKAFLSKQVDTYRPSYGKCVEEHPRQCVFFGTTNEANFLKGTTGNRRFWIVETQATLPRMDLFKELDVQYRDQVWAEAVNLFDNGEELFLGRELEALAREQQEDFNEYSSDERVGIIQSFLDKKLPLDWDTRSLERRKAYFRDTDPLSADGILERETVSAVEILSECFGQPVDDKARYKTREINALMKNVQGWEPGGNEYTKVYGRQRVYKRIGNETQEEDNI